MSTLSKSRIVAAVAVFAAPALMWGAKAVGTVVSDGDYRVDSSALTGSSTLFDGSSVETRIAPSRLELNRAWMLLGSDSKVRVAGSRLELERGTGEIGGEKPLEVAVRSLRVIAHSRAAARVKLDGPDTVLVGAVSGPVRVLNSAGTLIAMVDPGSTLSFKPQAAAPDAYDVTGCLLWKDGHYIVYANGAEIIVEGEKLAPFTGNRVHIVGASTMRDGSTVVRLRQIEQVSSGGCLAAAQATNGNLTAPGTKAPEAAKTIPAKAGTGPNKGVIAGIAVAAAAAAIAIPLATGGKKSGTS